MSSFTMSIGKENMSGPCKVCEQPGHGIHYGAWACDSCKCFFARSVKRGIENLVCNRGAKCNLSNRQPRTICEYCRFQKCLEVGMTKHTSHSLVQRAYIPNDMVSQTPSLSSSLPSSKFMGVDDVFPLTDPFDLPKLTEQQEINNIVETYKEGCCFTEDKVKDLEWKDFVEVNRQNANIARIKAWTDYAKEYEADIKALLPFIDELQDSFNSHDKALLLKRSAFQFYLIRRVRVLKSYGLFFSDGRAIEVIDLQFLYGIPLLNGMLKVVDRILRLGCTDDDLAVFISLVFFYLPKEKDLASLNLQNPEHLSPAQQKFKSLFVKHTENQDVDKEIVQELVNLWQELERLKVMHQERLQILKPYRWAFPDNSLFAEIYDLDPAIASNQYSSGMQSSLSGNRSH